MPVTTISIDIPEGGEKRLRAGLKILAGMKGTTASKLVYSSIVNSLGGDLERASSLVESGESQKSQTKRTRRTPESAR